MGRDSGWNPQRRDGGGTSWGDAWHFHKRDMLLAAMTAVILWFLSPPLLAWVSPGAAGPAAGGAAVARERQRTAGPCSRKLALLRTPEEVDTPPLGRAPRGVGRDRPARLPEDGLTLPGAQSRGAPGACRRQSAAARRSAGPSRTRMPSPRSRSSIDARSLEEALEWLTPVERVEVAGSARLLNQLALLPDAAVTHFVDLKDRKHMTDRRAVLKLAMGFAGGQLVRAAGAHAAPAPQPAAAGPAPAAPAAGRRRSPSISRGSRDRRTGSPSNAYQASKDVLPPAMAKLGYDQYQSIRFRSDHALWADAGLAFRVQFFHVGRNFTEPVHMYEVIDGQAREIVYDPGMFEWDKSGLDPGGDEGSRGVCRISRAIRHRLAGRRGGIPGRELFSRRRRRHPPIRPVGARARRRYRLPAARGVSALHLLLVRAARQGVPAP